MEYTKEWILKHLQKGCTFHARKALVKSLVCREETRHVVVHTWLPPERVGILWDLVKDRVAKVAPGVEGEEVFTLEGETDSPPWAAA